MLAHIYLVACAAVCSMFLSNTIVEVLESMVLLPVQSSFARLCLQRLQCLSA